MTLPSLIYLRENFSNAKIDFNCLEEFHELLSPFCLKWNINLIDRTVERYDAALFLQGKWRDSWELFLTTTPLRVGNYSKVFSFFLLNAGIRTTVHYKPLHMFSLMKKKSKTYDKLTNSKHLFEQILSLPLYPQISKKQQDFVIDLLLSV